MEVALNQGNLESQARNENIQEFLSVTKNFDENGETVDDESGVETLSRLNDLAFDCRYRWWAQETSEVDLMTLHAAKGLEFPVAWLEMEENVFPLSRKAEDPDELEEETSSGLCRYYTGREGFLDQCQLTFALDGLATTENKRVSSMKLARFIVLPWLARPRPTLAGVYSNGGGTTLKRDEPVASSFKSADKQPWAPSRPASPLAMKWTVLVTKRASLGLIAEGCYHVSGEKELCLKFW